MNRCIVLLLVLAGCDSCASSPDRSEPSAETAEPAEAEREEPVPSDPGWSRLDPPAAPDSLGAHLEATANGVVASWLETASKGHALRTATLRGDEWSEPVVVVESEDLVANWADFPRTTEGGDGALYAHALHRSGESPYAYEARLYRRSGERFDELGVIHADRSESEHGFVSMVPTDDGVRLFWLDGRNAGPEGATALYTATAGEDGVAAESAIDERVCDCCQTDAARLPSGPRVVYRDRDEAEHRDVAIGTAEERLGAVHDDGWRIAGCPVNGPAIDAEGARLVVAWFTGADGGAVHARFSDDGGRTFGPRRVIDDSQPPGRVDVELVDGGAVVSWLGRRSGAGEVRARFVGDDGTLGATQRVGDASARRDGGFPVLAREDDRLLVAHRGPDARLHVATLSVDALPRRPAEEPAAEEPALEEASLAEAMVRAVDDSERSLASLAAEGPTLVAFYARWCQPCRDELGRLEGLREAFGDRVVAVSLDEGSAERVTATARRWGFEGTVLRDGGAAAALGVPPLPALFLVDEGAIRSAWRGEAPSERAIRARLGELADRR